MPRRQRGGATEAVTARPREPAPGPGWMAEGACVHGASQEHRVWTPRPSLAKQGKETIAVRDVRPVSWETEPRPPRSRTGFGELKPGLVRAQEREERPGERGSPPGWHRAGLALPPPEIKPSGTSRATAAGLGTVPGGPMGEELVCRVLLLSGPSPVRCALGMRLPSFRAVPPTPCRQLCGHQGLYPEAGPPQSPEAADGAPLTQGRPREGGACGPWWQPWGDRSPWVMGLLQEQGPGPRTRGGQAERGTGEAESGA